MLCRNCQIETKNPSFCSRRCSVIFNNSISPKRKTPKPTYPSCLNCSGSKNRSTDKYCSKKCSFQHKWNEYCEQIKQTGLAHSDSVIKTNNTRAKKYITLTFTHQCSICKLTEWQNKPIVLILDHIDGHSTNGHISNLRLVCPNCDSQLPTFKARNKGNGRGYRRKS